MAGGSKRRKIPLGLFLSMAVGIAVYMRLWTTDYNLRQFELANREVMDESAGWRRMYDEQAEKASRCEMELSQENALLLKERELEASRLKCRS